jgi:hypothetical protein
VEEAGEVAEAAPEEVAEADRGSCKSPPGCSHRSPSWGG